jgi:hypothetical protein
MKIKNTSGKTLFYIINYEEGGFIILSSDKRSIPVLAYSTENTFVGDIHSYQSGLKIWMDDAKKQIETIQSSGSEQSRIAKKSWESVQKAIIGEVSSLKKEPIPDCWEHTEIVTEGPISAPTWHQKYPYNSALPYITCAPPDSTKHYFVGCVPLSLAVVMRYHEHPTSYAWSNMPYTYGTSTTADLIEDIHDWIKYESNNTQPDYDCESTGVTPNEMDDLLKDHFDYSTATYSSSFNHSTIKNDINYDRPVLFNATDEYVSSYKHTWVCTGWKEYIYYDDDCNSWSSMSYYMLWGQGTTDVGWYNWGSFNAGGYYLNDDLSMIYNIKP